ncbi:MAG TPA: VWA domain-containing protein [Spirochaetales bacterium]|nr:VWA domain-containing protein [Spirochaetales bacterium]
MARIRLSGALALAAVMATLAGCAGAPKTEGSAPAPKPAASARDTPSAELGVTKEARGEAAPPPAVMYDYGAAKPSSGAAGSRGVTPSSSGLKAGYSDDNEQFNYFVGFLEKYADVPHYGYDISERITVRVLDSAGKPVANAAVSIRSGGKELAAGLSYGDGSFRFYPAAIGSKDGTFELRASAGGLSAGATTRRDGPRTVELRLQGPRSLPDPLPLDLLFVMDTTGSMGEEIERLKATIEIIHDNLAALRPRPLVRLGLVLYKDLGDEYVTRLSPFTADLETFRAALQPVVASGGGDGPEDLESALDDAVNRMDWNEGGLRLAFVVTDAEAHLDYGRDYTYVDAANDARARAIKLYTIGTGGLPLEGEYLLRQVSQLTDARYIFLTYGEAGESDGGAEGSVSHHTGSNYQTDKLEAIVIRFVKEEVAWLSDTPVSVDEGYFSARPVDEESRDQTLGKLFVESVGNLADYSTFRFGPEAPCVILPVSASGDGLGPSAEYFGERLAMAASEAGRWKPVERKELQRVLAELELQLSGVADPATAARAGELLGADLAVASSLYLRDGRYELFMRLVRVSTAEVLSVARAKIEKDLGL